MLLGHKILIAARVLLVCTFKQGQTSRESMSVLSWVGPSGGDWVCTALAMVVGEHGLREPTGPVLVEAQAELLIEFELMTVVGTQHSVVANLMPCVPMICNRYFLRWFVLKSLVNSPMG
jgi:hypothetical protein